MLASCVLCQNNSLGELAMPAVPLHSWGRSEASCWQGRRGGGWFPFGEEGCSSGALGFAVLGTADELQLL